jgi:hypothetical protein
VGTLTESMGRLRDEIVTLRQKRSLGQAELARVAAERRAGVDAMRLAFSQDRALAHRAWFGPTVVERRTAEIRQERRLAEEASARAQAEQERKAAKEAKVVAQAEQERRVAEEARALAQAEQDRKLLEEKKTRMEAERKAAPAEETIAAPVVTPVARERKSSASHPASRKHQPSQNKASKRHSSK